MYCPSCDKTYGAIHSRCPECHSWLKVSAPASQRARSAASSGSLSGDSTPTSPASGSAVSTLDRDSGISWADPAPASGSLSSSWEDEPDNNWSSASSSAPSSSSAAAGSWGGGGDNWSGSSSDNESSADSGWGGSPASPAPSPPSAGSSSGWLGGDEADDGWSTGGLGGGASSTPKAPATPQAESGRGWLGDPQPSSGAVAEKQEPGWLGAGSAPAKSDPPSGQGWLGEGSGGSSYDSGSGGSGGGWLGDDPHSSSVPSMTEMVDQAIHDESDEDFVDDSWVDEEIRDSEFDELEIPEIIPPAPEIGGVALKMILVAVLVLLVGGGIFFMKKDSKTPEQIEAERIEKRAAFAQAAIEGGKEDLANGRAQLAIPQFQEAMVALSEVGATQKEIDDAEILLSKALMGSKEYKEAIEHWKSLKKSENPETAKSAKEGLNEAARELRVQANDELKKAKTYADKGESTSVLSRGRKALEVYKAYGGSAAQKGDAHGVIGRSYLNGRNYGSARDHLKKAVALAPNLGYQKYLKQVNAQLQPRYVAPVRSKRPSVRRPASKPSFDIEGPNYKTNNRRYSRNRRKSGGNSGGGSATSTGTKRKMKEIPIYQSKSRSKGNGRRGSKGVLQSY